MLYQLKKLNLCEHVCMCVLAWKWGSDCHFDTIAAEREEFQLTMYIVFCPPHLDVSLIDDQYLSCRCLSGFYMHLTSFLLLPPKRRRNFHKKQNRQKCVRSGNRIGANSFELLNSSVSFVCQKSWFSDRTMETHGGDYIMGVGKFNAIFLSCWRWQPESHNVFQFTEVTIGYCARFPYCWN